MLWWKDAFYFYESDIHQLFSSQTEYGFVEEYNIDVRKFDNAESEKTALSNSIIFRGAGDVRMLRAPASTYNIFENISNDSSSRFVSVWSQAEQRIRFFQRMRSQLV